MMQLFGIFGTRQTMQPLTWSLKRRQTRADKDIFVIFMTRRQRGSRMRKYIYLVLRGEKDPTPRSRSQSKIECPRPRHHNDAIWTISTMFLVLTRWLRVMKEDESRAM
jgi:hypothetical protein